MKETVVEKRLVDGAKKHGGKAYKWVSPGNSGVPDRIVLLPEGRLFFVELKRPGEKPRPLQVSVHKFMEKLGFKVYVIDTVEGVDQFYREVEE